MLCMAMYSLILCFQPEGTKHTFPVLKVKVRRKLLCTEVEKWRRSHFCNKASYIHQQFYFGYFLSQISSFAGQHGPFIAIPTEVFAVIMFGLI